ncbi:hypothetical protein [Lacimicrobium alkaliphilum]|uniref:Uncharacterized protein n=1 Tax=Lacimicrobium alkaliphilum TaxID=1526571 RepID=A0A0U3AYF1_9ALTE|nr:hypothetical protein [Lacimicrobium alkaliphilum]ALS97904.1 hypothetical protein AT746_06240 [Lacimicrobium alkaliphilum]
MNNTADKPGLSPAIRILIGIAGLPSIVLGYMLIATALEEGIADIGAFELVYSLVGVVALYIAITGKRLF